ncbi:hypothetical protein SAMN05660653_01661 [Desulfonatronum thiosulfatophilum]|uniref:Type II secretion system (T2SS), protein M subtype b n=1 Tax=Desulfonatronum thiosulfatophilum TaxID=617002 RepID=A0A1G6CNJ3_9BACT|nr:hypothetical protein [Desulfonatronum thiosulfatophilum]SDB34473.1 hypothetical protein SAMN05660653_01661 [Desulfonatronum thiosulfatophilum]
MSDSNVQLPAKALLLLFGGLALAALLGFFLVYPVWSDIERAEQRLRSLQTQVEVKRILGPSFSSLQAALGRLPTEGPFPLPDREPLGVDMDQLSQQLINMSAEHGLATRSVSPSMQDLGGRPRLIVVNLQLRGPLDAFRGFLLELLQQPHLDEVHSMLVREVGMNREYKLEFSLHYR